MPYVKATEPKLKAVFVAIFGALVKVSETMVPVAPYPNIELTFGVAKLVPVHKIRLSFNVNVFALVCASETFPFKTISPVKVGLTNEAYVDAAFVCVRYVLEASDDFK